MSKHKDIKEAKKELEKGIIKEILEYIKYGFFPNNIQSSYINAYNLVYSLGDCSDYVCDALFNYHNNIIQSFIEDCYKILNQEPKDRLIDSFIKQTDKIYFLIYWMNRIFTYLDRYYLRAKSKQSLAKNALILYKQFFFNYLEEDIYIEVNKLIKQDRNCNLKSRNKIKILLKILYDIDLDYPKVIRENNKIFFIPEKYIESKNAEKNKESMSDTLSCEEKWFEKYFKNETIKFAKEKGKSDIYNMSTQDYILSQLKYLKEEAIRQNEYINPRYHSKINEINYKFLIGENIEEILKMDKIIQYMFNTKRKEELKKAYQLFKLYPSSI